jgi:hypothetical protein
MDFSGSNKNKVVSHSLLWAGYFAFENILAWSYSGHFPEPITAFSHFALNIGLFYLLYLYTFPKLRWRHPLQGLLSALHLIITVTAFIGAKFLLDILLIFVELAPRDNGTTYLQQASGFLYRAIAFAFPALGLFNLIRYDREKTAKTAFVYAHFNKMLEEQAAEKLLSDNTKTMLNGHIDYHTLYGTFNYLNTRMNKNEKPGRMAISLISDMFRYTTSRKSQQALVSLREELKQLKSQLALKELIGGKRAFIRLEIPDKDYLIPRSIIMPLFLKLIKSSDISNSQNAAQIFTQNKNEMIYILFANFVMMPPAPEMQKELLLLNAYLAKKYKGLAAARDYHDHGKLDVIINIPISDP